MKSSNVILGKLLSALLLIVTSFSCRSSPTGPHVAHNVQLSADYVACTEVWLKISFGDTLGGNFAINRGGNTVLSGHFSGADTTVVDTTALPERTYNYVCWRMVNGLPKDSSSNLQVQTTDTTSNNFTWQTFTFGTGTASSSLSDVAIINDTLAYAVGAIYLNDSTGGVDPFPYNLVTWDGKNCGLKKVTVVNNGNTVDAPFYGIFAFSGNDIWISSGLPVHWDGNRWTQYQLYDSGVLGSNDGYLEKAWGEDSKDMYFTGTNGSIVHYDGHTWNKIACKTTSNINGIWGCVNSITGQEEILAVGWDILQIGSDGSVANVPWPIARVRNSIWFQTQYDIYTTGDGFFECVNGVWRPAYSTPYFTESVRGTGTNNVFVVGDFGFIAHFNGHTWQTYPQLLVSNGKYNSVAAKGNTVVAVGERGGYAMVLIGKQKP